MEINRLQTALFKENKLITSFFSYVLVHFCYKP